METPLPSRRITRSQASRENEESNNGVLKSSRQKKNCGKDQERDKPALIDITNGSPIIGLAMGCLKTPSSRCSKKKKTINSNNESKNTMTPGSGESLLRGQVKTLLQKVQEEDIISKICFVNSPMALLSATHADKPQVFNFSTSSNNGLNCDFNFTQMLNEAISEPNQEDDQGEDVEKNLTTRLLFSDFSEKSHDSDASDCNPLLTCQDSNASMWSIQVNASTSDEYKDYEDCEDVVVDELCEGISKVSVNNAVKFTGKHTRFVYNSDGELEGELSSTSSTSSSSSTSTSSTSSSSSTSTSSSSSSSPPST